MFLFVSQDEMAGTVILYMLTSASTYKINIDIAGSLQPRVVYKRMIDFSYRNGA